MHITLLLAAVLGAASVTASPVPPKQPERPAVPNRGNPLIPNPNRNKPWTLDRVNQGLNGWAADRNREVNGFVADSNRRVNGWVADRQKQANGWVADRKKQIDYYGRHPGAAFKDVTKTGLRVGLGAATLGATEHTGLGKSSGEVVDSAFNNVEQQINRVRGTGKPLPKSQSKPKSQYATGGYPQEQDSGVNEQANPASPYKMRRVP